MGARGGPRELMVSWAAADAAVPPVRWAGRRWRRVWALASAFRSPRRGLGPGGRHRRPADRAPRSGGGSARREASLAGARRCGPSWAFGSADRRSCRSSPQTTPMQSGVGDLVTITLPIHPLVGHALPLVREVRDRHRRLFLDVEHPRGWTLRVPADWTDRGPPTPTTSQPILGSVRGLRRLGRQVSAASGVIDMATDGSVAAPRSPEGRSDVEPPSAQPPTSPGVECDLPSCAGGTGGAAGIAGPPGPAAGHDSGGCR